VTDSDVPAFPDDERLTPERARVLAAELGLSDDEYDRVVDTLGRAPSVSELGMYSVMWSEHCSYKSSKIHLRTLAASAPWVLAGPGENAGVVDVGDGLAVAFKIESHNHPSFVEPYQGAATGVGGILRDIFTMGARPIAIMDPLRFGDPGGWTDGAGRLHAPDPLQRHLIDGVVRGVGGYGNCVGVPNIGGRDRLRRRLRRQPAGQRARDRGAAARASPARPRRGGRRRRGTARQRHRARRHRRCVGAGQPEFDEGSRTSARTCRSATRSPRSS
jgi:phosphoribosylformylglycinamidine (FGAM) synthase-like enzyme